MTKSTVKKNDLGIKTEDFLLEVPNDTKLLRMVGILNELSGRMESNPEYQQAISEAIAMIDLVSRYRADQIG